VCLQPDATRLCLRLEHAQARLDERVRLCLAQLDRERSRVDLRQLEQVVDEHAQRAHLLAQRPEVAVRIPDPVLERLDRRLPRGERCPQVGHRILRKR
jgi:hypothetical protein